MPYHGHRNSNGILYSENRRTKRSVPHRGLIEKEQIGIPEPTFRSYPQIEVAFTIHPGR